MSVFCYSRLYYAQALHKACLHEEAMKVSCQIDNPSYANKVGNSQGLGACLHHMYQGFNQWEMLCNVSLIG